MKQIIGPDYKKISNQLENSILEENQYKIDLHVHSNASYDVLDKNLSPLDIVNIEKERSLVPLISDHDTWDGHKELNTWKLENNEDFEHITSVEFSIRPVRARALFDGLTDELHTLHICVHNLSETEFIDLEAITTRGDLDEFVDYCRANKLPYVFNHIFWCEAGETLNWDAVPKLVKNYFDVVELNGKRTQEQNDLTLQLAEELGVAFIAASDNHIGEPGKAFTMAAAGSFDEFWWEHVLEKRVYVMTDEVTASSLLFEIKKFVHDFFESDPEYLRSKGFALNTGINLFQFLLDGFTYGRMRDMKLLRRSVEGALNVTASSLFGRALAQRLHIEPQKKSTRKNNEFIINACRQLNYA